MWNSAVEWTNHCLTTNHLSKDRRSHARLATLKRLWHSRQSWPILSRKARRWGGARWGVSWCSRQCSNSSPVSQVCFVWFDAIALVPRQKATSYNSTDGRFLVNFQPLGLPHSCLPSPIYWIPAVFWGALWWDVKVNNIPLVFWEHLVQERGRSKTNNYLKILSATREMWSIPWNQGGERNHFGTGQIKNNSEGIKGALRQYCVNETRQGSAWFLEST